MSFRTLLLACSTSSALLGLSNSANAQSALPADSSVPPTEQAAPRLEEIVVTAQRREENLQDVPIAISAVTASAAQKMGVTGTDTLTIATPGLTYTRSTANGGIPFLRGVGTELSIAGTESPVAVYLDDVYVGATSGNVFSFNNIDSVAVLKGPQGTLFGRNATGGVIQVRSKAPSRTQELDASVGYGNFDTTEGNVYFNTPVSETLAVNIAATGKDQGKGYGRSLTTGKDIYKESSHGVRGAALWQPSSDTSVLLRGDYYEFDGDLGLNNLIPEGAVTARGGTNVGKYVSPIAPPDTGHGSNYGGSLKLDHDSDWAKLVSISAYRVANLHFRVDQDGSTSPFIFATIDTSTKNFSQEFQVLSPDSSRLKWIGGLFYFRSRAAYDPLRVTGTSQARQFTDTVAQQTLNSMAGFGEVKYDVLPQTNLTLGVRYTRDEYDLTGARYDALGLVPGQTFSPPSSVNSKLTYRAILDHNFTDDVMVYASFSRGFKSGGFNLTTPNLPAVDPEVLDAYEVGVKSELFERMLRFNASAYHYDYANLQVQSIQGGGQATTINAAAARIRGVDAELTFQPTERFSLSGGFAFIHSEFTSFPNGPAYVPQPAVCAPAPTTTGPRTGGNLLCAADLSGNRTILTPKFSGSITAAYALPTAAGEFGLSATLYHSSMYFFEPDNRTNQPSYSLVNGTLSWISPSGRYEARLWGKNLLDEYYFAAGTESAQRDGVMPAMPRSYGITFGVHL